MEDTCEQEEGPVVVLSVVEPPSCQEASRSEQEELGATDEEIHEPIKKSVREMLSHVGKMGIGCYFITNPSLEELSESL